MAAENDAINLSQGFPDFKVADQLITSVNRYMAKGMNQYAPMAGVPALRERIAEMSARDYGFTADPEKHITITAGATEALYAVMAAIVREGDEVIVFDPAYDSYDPAIRLNGGVPVHLKLKQPDFSIDWEEVKSRLNGKVSAIIINTPHNPSGAILRHQDLVTLEEIATEHDLIVISDEVYQHIIFDEERHESVLRYPGLRERSVAAFSFGKTFHATGWKVGYTIAPEWLTTEIRKIHQYLTFSVNTPVQYALADYLSEPDHYLALPNFFQKKRDHFLALVKDSRFKTIDCTGTYFQLLSYDGISELDDRAMAEELTKKHGLASIPISVFYKDAQDDKLLRFCFAKSDETLEKAAEILCKI